jgi:branched-chain amino acid transport system ATP-binding protein
MNDAQPTTLLEVQDLNVFYGKHHVVRNVSLRVNEGEVVAIIGRNGAGKTTIARAISGLTAVAGGHVRLGEEEVTNLPPQEIVQRGMSHVPEGRRVFTKLSVRDNLLVGAYKSSAAQERLEQVTALFPILRDKLSQRAGQLSGGQQQMLALARALMAGPRVMVIDEPTMGLAPIIVQRLAESLRELVARERLSVILIDQQVSLAASVAGSAHILRHGQIVGSVGAEQIRSAEVREMYLGSGSGRSPTAGARAGEIGLTR